jgi:hypothetical protein
MDKVEEMAFRPELKAAGEAQVHADFYGRGGLSTGGEDRAQLVHVVMAA